MLLAGTRGREESPEVGKGQERWQLPVLAPHCPWGEGRQARAEGAPQALTPLPDAKMFIGVKK